MASGECIITASQAGNAQYAAAQPIDVQLTLGGQPQLYFVHPDHLGSPRVVTQASGNVRVWEWKNADAFGNNLPDENPTGLATAFKYHLRFPGQYFDQETSTHYNMMRDYDPATGRYVQSDPIGLKGGINTYAYVMNNPLGDTDPDGLLASSLGGLGRGALAGGARGSLGGLGGLGGLAGGMAIGALLSQCQPTDREKCERQCDRDYDRAVAFCHSMAAMKGKPGTKIYKATYQQCMEQRQTIYVECYQNCSRDFK